jgi:hypothetical protein
MHCVFCLRCFYVFGSLVERLLVFVLSLKVVLTTQPMQLLILPRTGQASNLNV